MAVCIAVIAKENYPLYIRSVSTQNELKFHYTVHTSLDVVEEKISAVGKSLGDQRELYLGLLYPTEDYKVYGYVTNSKVKFVIVVDSSNTSLRDNEIRSVSEMTSERVNVHILQGSDIFHILSTDVPKIAQLLHRCNVQPIPHSRELYSVQGIQ
ncbi:trafficking protein particle complex subunit 2-like protein isoform X1 [Dunckerocampus dactyliophorus]|uniref:trafficking protein particle complex subunit 2-like protein isoform X1 n=1 Tax=Dunckerocampus dactyliophorus TaxID=161453 RepID=UPI0024051137|nr:trafficking protein particle complex subunit 2-like protein isoform X1 [Dunckerocampus dactyliophorus]